MTICYFGMFAANYSRNKIFLTGLSVNNVTVIKVNDRSHLLWGARYLKLLVKFLLTKSWRADVIFVGFPGQTDVPLAWLLGKLFGKKVAFDAFYSLYVSHVFDRKRIKKSSLRAKCYWLVDYWSCRLADIVILDTQAHSDYFTEEFNLRPEKFHRIFVGTDPEIIKPTKVPEHQGVVVGFHGSYLPLQGVPVILDAAKLLEKNQISFELLGNGVDFAKCQQQVKDENILNVKFLKEVPYVDLPKFISACDIYLGGPFGDSLKSNLVIPNKVFEGLAVRKPVIVGKSNAIAELLTDGLNCLVVEQGDPSALAKSILKLASDQNLRTRLSKNGYNLIMDKLTPKKLAHELVQILT